METAGNCIDPTSGPLVTFSLKIVQKLLKTVRARYHVIARRQLSKVLSVLLAAATCTLLSVGLSSTSCVLGQCFGLLGGIRAADIMMVGSCRIGSSSSNTSHHDFLLNPANFFLTSAPSGVMMLQATCGSHCNSNDSSRRSSHNCSAGSWDCIQPQSDFKSAPSRSEHQQGASTGDSVADGPHEKAAGSVADGAAVAAGEGGEAGAPAAGAGGGAEVAVADPSASDDVDLHELYQSLSGIAWWMMKTNKEYFPTLTPLSTPTKDSSMARGGAAAAGGGLDAVQLATASMQSACRATSAPGMQLKGRKFLMLAQTWEQLSQTRLHLIEAMALAKMLNRTLVLTQVW